MIFPFILKKNVTGSIPVPPPRVLTLDNAIETALGLENFEVGFSVISPNWVQTLMVTETFENFYTFPSLTPTLKVLETFEGTWP